MTERKKMAVTGGAGFIGRNLIEGLAERGYQIVCADIHEPSWLPPQARYAAFDFTDPKADFGFLDGTDGVFHLASTMLPATSNQNPVADIECNLAGSVRLLEASRRYGVRRFIFSSSGGTVYGNPEHVPMSELHPTHPRCSYGIVKLAVEKYLELYYQQYALDGCSLRLANPYGEYQRTNAIQGAIAVFCGKALRGEPIEIWGDGEVIRDFIYIKDAVEAMIQILEEPKPICGRAVNIGGGRGASLNEVLDLIEQHTQCRLDRRYLPGRKLDVREVILDISLAWQLFGWRPMQSLSDGIERYVKWLKGVEKI